VTTCCETAAAAVVCLARSRIKECGARASGPRRLVVEQPPFPGRPFPHRPPIDDRESRSVSADAAARVNNVLLIRRYLNRRGGSGPPVAPVAAATEIAEKSLFGLHPEHTHKRGRSTIAAKKKKKIYFKN